MRILSLTALLLFTDLLTNAQAASPPVFLIHGANFSGASWSLVQEAFSKVQVPMFAPELYQPQENVSLSDVSARLCSELAKLNEPAILVGHSQGGAIITEAAGQCPASVKFLIYVAAVIPQPGEGVFDRLSDTDNNYYNQCGKLNTSNNEYELIDFKACWQVFMQDASVDEAAHFYGTMVSEPASIGNSKADYNANVVASIPKYYIQTKNDLIISLDTQNKIIAGLKFEKVFQIESSHSPFIKMAPELSQILDSIIRPSAKP
jgi:pimeloyl-ACP methyl ester carboxylesterase